jgi:hypothetical protein
MMTTGGAPRLVRPWRTVAGHFSLVSGRREDGEDARIVGSYPMAVIRWGGTPFGDLIRTVGQIGWPILDHVTLNTGRRSRIVRPGLNTVSPKTRSNPCPQLLIHRLSRDHTPSAVHFCKRVPALYSNQPAIPSFAGLITNGSKYL